MTTILQFDLNGNAVTKNDSSGVTIDGAAYTLDNAGNRTAKTDQRTAVATSYGYDSIYAYDADNLVEETNSSGAVVARYTQTQNVDEPLAMLRSATTNYYHADGLGSITSLSNAAGSLAQTYTFDSFGKQTASSGAVTNPFQYTARELDPETNLYFYRARYYDTNVGRFVNEDPARFGGGLNVYAYVKGDPVDFVDPTGLKKCWQSSPWTQIPQLWGSNGPAPYLTLDDGLFWVSTGWSYASLGLDKTHCVCTWVADHTRKRRFYRVPVKEQAQFTCDCPARTYYETRDRTKEYEVDSPDKPILSLQTTVTIGTTFQLSDTVGSHPNSKSNVICSCLAQPPAP